MPRTGLEGRPQPQQEGRHTFLKLIWESLPISREGQGVRWPCFWSQDTDVPSFVRVLLPPAALEAPPGPPVSSGCCVSSDGPLLTPGARAQGRQGPQPRLPHLLVIFSVVPTNRTPGHGSKPPLAWSLRLVVSGSLDLVTEPSTPSPSPSLRQGSSPESPSLSLRGHASLLPWHQLFLACLTLFSRYRRSLSVSSPEASYLPPRGWGPEGAPHCMPTCSEA